MARKKHGKAFDPGDVLQTEEQMVPEAEDTQTETPAAEEVTEPAPEEPAAQEPAAEEPAAEEVTEPVAEETAEEPAAEEVTEPAAEPAREEGTEPAAEDAVQAEEAPAAEDAEQTGETALAVAAPAEISVVRKTAETETDTSNQSSTSRIVFVVFSILLGGTAGLAGAAILGKAIWFAAFLVRAAAILIILRICSQNKSSSLKMPWILLIMAAPVAGITLYLLIGNSGSTKNMRLRFANTDTKLLSKLPRNQSVLSQLQDKDNYIGNIASYIKSFAGFPVYRNTDVTYFPDAEKALEAQTEALEKAEKSIFMEYRLIEDGEAFRVLEEILGRKAKEGVDVRLLYDDMGSAGFVSEEFTGRLKEKGIRCRSFNPFAPGVRQILRNRDNRRMTIVDNETGFTGRYNIANEYFDEERPYGEIKGTGLRLEGEAVRSLTALFLEMWHAVRQEDVDDRECAALMPDSEYKAREDGFVQPYADSPLDDEQVAENVYISLISHAAKSFRIMSPDLVLTGEMAYALGLAARRGVNVQVVTSGIRDRKLNALITSAWYRPLAVNGVHIYEYTPGILHAAQCTVDGKTAVCGTVSLDCRGFFHHFEDACLFTGCQAVADMDADFDAAIAASKEVTEDYRSGRPALLRFRDLVLRFFAPLL